MIGYRGALRYVREPEVFRLELAALERVWDAGHRNVHVMLPFVRNAPELERCMRLITECGLTNRHGFQVWVMAEYADLLVRAEIDAVSVNLDAVDRARRLLDAAERRVTSCSSTRESLVAA